MYLYLDIYSNTHLIPDMTETKKKFCLHIYYFFFLQRIISFGKNGEKIRKDQKRSMKFYNNKTLRLLIIFI
jgi:hypothetical protein